MVMRRVLTTLALVGAACSGLVACTDSSVIPDNAAAFVFPTSDYTGRSFKVILPGEETATQVYASPYDPAFVQIRNHLMVRCFHDVMRVRTLGEEEAAYQSLYAESPAVWQLFYGTQLVGCDIGALLRAELPSCLAASYLDLAESVTLTEVVRYRIPQAPGTLSGYDYYDLERGDETKHDHSDASLRDVRYTVPPQDAHGAGTLALLAATAFRDAALRYVELLDPRDINASTAGVQMLCTSAQLNSIVVAGADANGEPFTDPSLRRNAGEVVAARIGAALDDLDTAMQVVRRTTGAAAHAHLSSEADAQRARVLSWRAPMDSRLEMVNFLAGTKPTLFEPEPVVLPMPPLIGVLNDAGVQVPVANAQGQFLLPDGGLATPDDFRLVAIPTKGLLNGDFPVVDMAEPSPEVARAVGLIRGLGVDPRVRRDANLVAEEPTEAELESGDYADSLLNRLQRAVMKEYAQAFSTTCDAEETAEEFFEGIGLSKAQVLEAAERVRKESRVFGRAIVVDLERSDCGEPASICAMEADDFEECENVTATETSDDFDRRVLGLEASAVHPMYYYALTVARARNVPGLHLANDDLPDAGTSEQDFVIDWPDPAPWYPGSTSSEIANVNTGFAFAAEQARGYAGQGVFQTRDAVALKIAEIVALRGQTGGDLAISAPEAVETLETLYATHREAIPMRLLVCTGPEETAGTVDGAVVMIAGADDEINNVDFAWKVVSGEDGLGCALDPNKRLTDCGGPPPSAQNFSYLDGAALALLNRSFVEFRSFGQFQWSSEGMAVGAEALPIGRYYLVRKAKQGTSEVVGVAADVMAGFTLEPGGWTNPGEEEPVTFTSGGVRVTRCNWYPLGDEVVAAVSGLLTPGTKDPSLPQVLCGDADQSYKLPLEDSLSNSAISGETVESSFRHFLTLARQAANEADLLGEAVIRDGLEMDVRAEAALGELEAVCGGVLNASDISGEIPSLSAPNEGEHSALINCLGGGETVDVSLGTKPLCYFRWQGTGGLCAKTPSHASANVECPFQAADLAACQAAAATKFQGLPLCPTSAPNCYEVGITEALAVVNEEVEVATDVPTDCSLVAKLRTQPSLTWQQRDEFDALVANVLGQPWANLDGARDVARGIGLSHLAPELMLGWQTGFDYELEEQTPIVFTSVRLGGQPWISTGTVEGGPTVGYPFGPRLQAPPEDPIWNNVSCPHAAYSGANSIYCSMSDPPTPATGLVGINTVSTRLSKAVARIARLSALEARDAFGSYQNSDGRTYPFWGFWGQVSRDTGLVSLQRFANIDSSGSHLGTHVRTIPLPQWLRDYSAVYAPWGINTSVDTNLSLAEYTLPLAWANYDPRYPTLGGEPPDVRSTYRCIGDSGTGGTCFGGGGNYEQWFDEAVPLGDRYVSLIEPSSGSGAAQLIAGAQAEWANMHASILARDLTLFDALELLCQAKVAGGGSVVDSCGGYGNAVPTINGVIEMKQRVECSAQQYDNLAATIMLADVPASLAHDLKLRGLTDTSASNAGEFGQTVGRYRAALENLGTTSRDVASIAREAAGQLAIVDSELNGLQMQLQIIAAQSSILDLEGDINDVRDIIRGLETASKVLSRAESCARAGSNALDNATSFGASGAIACSFAVAQAALDIAIAGYEQKVSNLEENILAKKQEINDFEADILDEEVAQLVLSALMEFQSKLKGIDDKLSELAQAYANVNSIRAELDGHTRSAKRALGRAAFLDRDDVGREYNVNRVMRSRLNTGKLRYDRARDNAIKMAWIARRAIEQRIGVNLSEVHTDMTLVPPPATWADTVCTMTGINYDRIRSVDDTLKIEDYADGYIGDYVTLLENFVESYRFDYPFQDGEDVAILSMRDEVFGNRVACNLEGQNDLLWSADPSHVGLNDEPGWNAASSVVDGHTIHVSSAAAEGGPFVALGTSRPLGNITASRIELAWMAEDSDPETPVTGSSSAAEWQQVIPAMEPGTYIVSWYEQLLEEQTDTGCDDDPVFDEAQQQTGLEVFLHGGEGEGAWTLLPGGDGTGFLNPASDDPTLDRCNWRRVVGTFTLSGTEPQDVTLGFKIRANVLEEGPLPSVIFAGPQIEGPGEAMSAIPSLFFLTDDDYSHPVGTCADHEGRYFSTPLNWSYGCETICRDGLGTACDTATASGNGRCFHEASFNISLADIERGKLGQAGGFAVGNFNYRFNEVGINLVGTGLRDCASTDTPATCYSSAFIPYSIRHSPPYRIRNYEGEVVEGNLFPGNIEHAKGLMAERYITNPIGSADRTLLTDYWRREFRGRPLEGNFRLRIWDSPGFDFSKLEDIQLILSYRYWTRAQ